MPGFTGGAEGDRTPGLMNAIHALSQLSYSPTRENDFGGKKINYQDFRRFVNYFLDRSVNPQYNFS
jgi:hypothetical protein